jgi:hypothetical protein
MPCGAKLRFLGMFGGMRRDTAVCGSRQRSRQRCCEAAFLGCEPWHDSGRTTFSEARVLLLPLFTELPRRRVFSETLISPVLFPKTPEDLGR